MTQDTEGEYGHGAHRAVADAAQKCVVYAADESSRLKLTQSEPWQVKKLYIHLWKQDRIALDWHVPLAAFDGEDGLSVCRRAMQCHASQLKHGWKIEDGGDCDNAVFGLAYTTVGPDVKKDDLMENIPLAADTGSVLVALPD